MRIRPSHFDRGVEVDCKACVRMILPPFGKVTGRASIRRRESGRYEAYLKLHPPHGSSFGALPRIEVTVHETDSLQDMIAWTNQAWTMEDTVEEER